MEQVAIFFKRLLIDKESPESVARDVEEYSRGFLGVEYSF
jgi:glycine hydroxymethyltransferase